MKGTGTNKAADKENCTAHKCILRIRGFTRNVPTASHLRTYLRSKIPLYLLPGPFVFLDSLPLTLNGKVNRVALPKTGRGRRGEQQN